jgi:single-stranded-DNA-specific exonuclease
MEHHYRPTIVLTESNGKLTGSGRSIRGLDLHQALHGCSEHLEQFGGHAFAAGMTLLPEKLLDFKIRFNQIVQDMIQP